MKERLRSLVAAGLVSLVFGMSGGCAVYNSFGGNYLRVGVLERADAGTREDTCIGAEIKDRVHLLHVSVVRYARQEEKPKQ